MSAVPLRVTGPVRGHGPATAPRTLPSPRGFLRLVPQRRSKAARTPFAVVLVVLLVGGLLGLLLLNTLVAQDSFALHDLAAQSRQLQLREQQLASRLEDMQAPEHLADRAGKLGMVPGGPPAFLRLPDGRVLGKATKGKPAPQPQPQAAAQTTTKTAAQGASQSHTSAGATQPTGSTTWTAPRQTPPPTSTEHNTGHNTGHDTEQTTGAHR